MLIGSNFVLFFSLVLFIIRELTSTKLLLILSILKFEDLLLFLADDGEVLSSSVLLNVVVVGLII